MKTVQGWRQRTPEGFTFALKLPQEITHERHLKDPGDVLVGQLIAIVTGVAVRALW